LSCAAESLAQPAADFASLLQAGGGIFGAIFITRHSCGLRGALRAADPQACYLARRGAPPLARRATVATHWLRVPGRRTGGCPRSRDPVRGDRKERGLPSAAN
jgi:hypothetical protein